MPASNYWAWMNYGKSKSLITKTTLNRSCSEPCRRDFLGFFGLMLSDPITQPHVKGPCWVLGENRVGLCRNPIAAEPLQANANRQKFNYNGCLPCCV